MGIVLEVREGNGGSAIMSAKHTPTPCKIEPEPTVSLQGKRGFHYYIRFSDGNRVLCADKNLAEFIVRAVNDYDKHGEIIGVQNLQIRKLIKDKQALLEFVKDIAADACYRTPGEYPDAGEDGKAPCRSCQAREIIAQAEGKK